MAAGYEARARVTADVSGFVAAARSVAAASNAAAAAVRSFSTQVMATQRAAGQSASNLQSFAQAAAGVSRVQQQNSQTASQAAQSASQMAQAYNQGAAAADRSAQSQRANAQAQATNVQSLQRMGRELARLRAEQERYQSLVAQGHRLNRDQAESYAQIQARIGQLTRSFLQLNSEQRQVVTAAREVAQANRFATQGIQEHAAANTRLAQTGRLTFTQLQQLGREIQRVSQQYTALNQSAQARGQATQAEAAAMRTLQQTLGALIGTYRQLDQAQRGVVNSARANVGATQAAATATRNLGSASAEASAGMRGLDNSLWSLRSALGDLQGFLNQTTSMFRRAATELASTFSEQEMAIAHISRVTQATMGEMDILTEGIRELARVIPLPFEELGMIARLGAQVGIAKDAIVDFTETVALFAATTDVTAEAASTMFARIQQMTDIDDTQFRNLGAAVSELGSNSAATENEILTVVESISTMADQAGMSGQAIIGLGSAMASLRIRPEIARGATQRVFLQLSSAVEEAGGSMERLIDITGLTETELQNLAASDYDQFFMRIMEGLSGAYEAGEPLVPLLRQIGIQNSRDAEVVARLAANYEVLSSSMEMANASFASGTYLQREADRIFQTITAQVQIMTNAWEQFKFAIVEAIGPFIEMMVSGATAVMEFVSQSELLVGIFGRLLIVGAVVALFAAMVGIITAVTQAWIAVRTAVGMAAVSMGLMSASAAQNASVMGLLGASARGAAASLGAFAASAGVAGVAAGALTAALRFIAPIAVITAVMTLASTIRDLTQSAQEANRAHLDAAGGVETLKQAMIDDTQAAAASRDAIVFRRQALEEMTDEELEAAESSRSLAARQGELARELGTSSEAMSAMGDAAQAGTGAYNELGVAITDTGAAIGEANQAFAALTAESVITENGILSNTAAFRQFQSALSDFGGVGGVIEAELEKPGRGADQAREAIQALQEEMGFLERNLGLGAQLLSTMTGGFADFRTDAWLAVDALADFEGGLQGLSEAQIEALNSLELFQGELRTAEDGTVELVGGLGDLTGEMDGMGEAADSSAEAIANFAQGVGSAFGSLAELGQGLEEEEKNLANYTRQLEEMMEARVNFATNLMELQGRVSDETLAHMAQNQEQFAPILEELAGASDEVITNFEDMLSFVEGELNERYTSAMEELVVISADSAQGIVAAQLDELNTLWEEGKIGPREYVEELEALLDSTTTGFSGVTQEQVDAITGMFDGTREQAEAMADSLITTFDGAGDVTSMMIAEQIRLLKSHFDDGEISAEEFVNSIVGILADGDYIFEPELDGDEALRDTGDLSDNIRQTALDTEAIFTPAVMGDLSEAEMESLTALIERLADNSDPTFVPETNGNTAESEMNSTRSSVESTARNSTPTFRARTDGSSAFSDMGSIMSSLRNMASTIWVSVGAVAGNILGGGRKDGGWINGAGGPRQDANLYAVSDREFVVNARDAEDYAPLLEWINSQRGRGGGEVPSMVPPDIMDMPSRPITGRTMAPDRVAGAQRTNMDMRGPNTVITVNNQFPQAEPTSTTITRSMAYLAVANGTLPS